MVEGEQEDWPNTQNNFVRFDVYADLIFFHFTNPSAYCLGQSCSSRPMVYSVLGMIY